MNDQSNGMNNMGYGQQPMQQQPMNGMNYVQPSKTNGLAIAGLILSIIGGFILTLVGLILSCVGLGKAKECNSGKGVAIAGIVIAIIKFVLIILLLLLFKAAIDMPEFAESYCKELGEPVDGVCTKNDDGTYDCNAIFKHVTCEFDEKKDNKEDKKDNKVNEKEDEPKEVSAKDKLLGEWDWGKLGYFVFTEDNELYLYKDSSKSMDNVVVGTYTASNGIQTNAAGMKEGITIIASYEDFYLDGVKQDSMKSPKRQYVFELKSDGSYYATDLATYSSGALKKIK
jgi:hypothetical protein